MATASIAVLPFADMSPKHDQEYFAEGVAEEILSALSHVEGLKVVGRTSSFSFKGKSDNLKSIGQKLGVANILEGSLRKDGNGIRIKAQLIRVADGTHLWSESYDRKLAGIFKVQEEIAKAVVGALKVKLLPGDRPGSDPVRTVKPEAYQAYLLGRHFLAQFSNDFPRRSVEAFEQALRIDPGYAPAWAGPSVALYARADVPVPGATVDEHLEDNHRALDAANRAVALAPDLGDGYVARAEALMARGWNWTGSLADARRAIELDPRNARAYWVHARLLMESGRVKEAGPEFQRAVELDPLSAEAWLRLWFGYTASGQHEEAGRAMERARELSPTNRVNSSLAGPLTRETAGEIVRRDPGSDCASLHGKVGAHLFLEQHREAQEALGVLIAKCGGAMAWQIAEHHCALGDRDRAFEWLERARVWMDQGLRNLKNEGKCFRGDPRTAAILMKMNLPVD